MLQCLCHSSLQLRFVCRCLRPSKTSTCCNANVTPLYCLSALYRYCDAVDGLKQANNVTSAVRHRRAEENSSCRPGEAHAQAQTPSSSCYVRKLLCWSVPCLLCCQHPTRTQRLSAHLHCHRCSSCGAEEGQGAQQTSWCPPPPAAPGGHVGLSRFLRQMADPQLK